MWYVYCERYLRQKDTETRFFKFLNECQANIKQKKASIASLVSELF